LERLDALSSTALECYCSDFQMLQKLKAEIEDWNRRGHKVRGGKSALATLRRHCREWALEFGMGVDRSGRMRIERPLPLSTKYDRLEKRIQRECARRGLPTWLAPDATIDANGRREYYRIVLLPRVRRRVNATGDTTTLNEYAKAFENFVASRDQIRNLQRIKDKQDWIKRSIESHEEFLRNYEKRCQHLATQLGFFFRPEARKRRKSAQP